MSDLKGKVEKSQALVLKIKLLAVELEAHQKHQDGANLIFSAKIISIKKSTKMLVDQQFKAQAEEILQLKSCYQQLYAYATRIFYESKAFDTYLPSTTLPNHKLLMAF